MRWVLGFFLPILGILAHGAALAQSPTRLCYPSSQGATNCITVNPAAPLPVISGGGTQARVASAATNNSTLLAAGAHTLASIHLGNGKASIVYVKFYNKATAPTCGTDTPIATFAMGANGGRIDFDGALLSVTLGLGYCIVTGAADNDNTAVAANDVHGYVAYR